VVWMDNAGSVVARHRLAATRGWSSPVNIATGQSVGVTPLLVIQPAGVVHLVWRNGGGDSIQAAVGHAGDSMAWGSVRLLATPLSNQFVLEGNPRVVPLPLGGAMVAWEERNLAGTFFGVVRARRIDASGLPMGSAPTTLSISGTDQAAFPALAVRQGGAGRDDAMVVHVAWRWSGTGQDHMLLRRWNSVTDTWEHNATAVAEMTVATVPHAEGRMGPPTVAAAVGGGVGATRPAYIAWGEVRLADGRFRLRTVRVLDSAEAPAVLEAPGVGALAALLSTAPLVTVDRAGNALVVYEHPVVPANGGAVVELRSQRRLWSADRWSDAGVVGVSQAQAQTPRTYLALVGASETGAAMVWWVSADISSTPLRLRRFD